MTGTAVGPETSPIFPYLYYGQLRPGENNTGSLKFNHYGQFIKNIFVRVAVLSILTASGFRAGCGSNFLLGVVSKEAILFNLVKMLKNQINKNNYLWIPAFAGMTAL